ncbi:cyclic pyranopterin monophosphate synthase MoaC [Robertkochia aurantiaca]|uniref:cyclic pyranopterin monophosphate synthase MoaC n=1 Tax=Robertkochia aurantiaca TaxID=2873700 RepID=UPI001CC908B7|nr:cyclic pyranopterin monophosphate synthase MoaC [Robertkochia sp. 3YJGBD-33]
MSDKKLSHIDEKGNASMVDVSHKSDTARRASASGLVIFPEAVFRQLEKDGFTSKKGAIIQTAVIAGIQGVKKTADLIPMCHPLMLDKIQVDIVPEFPALKIECRVGCFGKTGVEMEALTGVNVAALTIYDMCKALSHDIRIENIELRSKHGGKNDIEK